MEYVNRNPTKVGRPPRPVEFVLEALFYRIRTGCPWRDLPERLGPWQTIHGRFLLWCKLKIWDRALRFMAKRASGKLRIIDATHIKVLQAGANPVGGAKHQALGITKGGRNTKLHALVDGRGRAVALLLTAGQIHDIPQAEKLLTGHRDCIVLGDLGYDSDAFREYLRRQGNEPCIPGRKNRKAKPLYHKGHYKKRHRVENFFCRIKRFTGVAARREKLAISFLGVVTLAALIDWIS